MSETTTELIAQAKEQACSEANVLPMASERELREMADDIAEQGLLDPVVLDGGLILDGRNRWVACKIAGVGPVTEEWDGQGSRMSYVLSKNLKRRHLDAGQKAAAAVEALPFFEAEAKKRERLGKEIIPDPETVGQARDHAAEQFDVNPRYVSDAKRFKERSPEIFDRVKSGELSIPKAKVAERIQAASPVIFQEVMAGKRELSDAAGLVLSEPITETPEEKAYFGTVNRLPIVLLKLDPVAVAGVCSDAEARLASYEEVAEWMGKFAKALRSQAIRPLRAVK